jgi:hypothetical protein
MKIIDLYFESDLLKVEYSVEGTIDINLDGVGSLSLGFEGKIDILENAKTSFQFDFLHSKSYLSEYNKKIKEFANNKINKTELYELIKKRIIEEE